MRIGTGKDNYEYVSTGRRVFRAQKGGKQKYKRGFVYRGCLTETVQETDMGRKRPMSMNVGQPAAI